MGEFKAIETKYKAHRFRSRTEARWKQSLSDIIRDYTRKR